MDAAEGRDPDWLIRAHDWVDARLAELGVERTGAIEQPHVRPWATVLRVPAARGDVWFKADAVAPALRLGWVCRAINGHVPGDDDHTRTRLRMFLDGRP